MVAAYFNEVCMTLNLEHPGRKEGSVEYCKKVITRASKAKEKDGQAARQMLLGTAIFVDVWIKFEVSVLVLDPANTARAQT